MIRFLSLHGDMTGSARINEQRSGVEVCLKLRSRVNSALQAFITDGKRIAAIRIVDGCGTGENMNVRGLLLCGEGGELLAFGSVDMGRAESEEFKTKVRFILNVRAEERRLQQMEYARRQQTTNPKEGEGAGRAEKPKPESPATAEILERAEQLFRGGAQAAKPMGKHPDTAHTEREAVENPFPSFFENSYWWREVNDNTRIFGVANIRGIKYRIVAVRSNAKYPPRGMGRNARRLISSGGKWYWVGLWKMQQM